MPRLMGGPYQDLQPVAEVPVKGVDGGGDVAIAPGDTLFLTVADSPRISKKATGTVVARALGSVAAGAVASIPIVIIW
jgi:hypothetical protein